MLELTFWVNRAVWLCLLHWKKKKSGLMGLLLGTRGSLTQTHLHTDITRQSASCWCEAAQAALRGDWRIYLCKTLGEKSRQTQATKVASTPDFPMGKRTKLGRKKMENTTKLKKKGHALDNNQQQQIEDVQWVNTPAQVKHF